MKNKFCFFFTDIIAPLTFSSDEIPADINKFSTEDHIIISRISKYNYTQETNPAK